MKTTRQLVEIARNEIVDIIGAVPEEEQLEIKAVLLRLAKEQDRNTRHHCAEEVSQLPGCHTSDGQPIYDMDHRPVDKTIDANQAHNVCMNSRAINLIERVSAA